jgi:hypothetical protein
MAALVILAVVSKPQVFSRVVANGSLLVVQRPTLNLTGPFTCSDNGLSS